MTFTIVAFLQDSSDSTAFELPPALAIGIPTASLVAALLLALAIGRHRGRGRELQRIAAAENLVYSDGDPAGISSLRFPTFATARGVVIRNTLTLRTDAGDVRSFDFALWDEHESRRSDRDSGRGPADELFGFDAKPPTETRRSYSRARSGAVVRVEAFLPPCTIRPATWATRAIEAMGAPDLDFESDEFNVGWDVRCSDERFASLFVDAQLIDLVLSFPNKLAIETLGNYILLSTSLCRPADQLQLLRSAARFPFQLSPVIAREYPTAFAMQPRPSERSWQERPKGRDGPY